MTRGGGDERVCDGDDGGQRAVGRDVDGRHFWADLDGRVTM